MELLLKHVIKYTIKYLKLLQRENLLGINYSKYNNAECSFIVEKQRTRVFWALKDNMLPIHGTNAMMKIPNFFKL